MKKFRVELTEKENNYNFTGEWDSDFAPDDFIAENETAAIEDAKQYIIDNGGDPDLYIFRARPIE